MGKQNNINSDFANSDDGQKLVVDSSESKGYRLGVKSNYSTSAAPTVNDDDTQNYEPLSFWFDSDSYNGYYCVTNTTGGALWKRLLPVEQEGSSDAGKVTIDRVNDPDVIFPYYGSGASDFVTGSLASADPNTLSYAGSNRGSIVHEVGGTGGLWAKTQPSGTNGWYDLQSTVEATSGGVDNAIMRANGTGGTVAQTSSATIDDSGNIAATGITFNSGTNYLNSFEDWTFYSPTISGSTTSGVGTYTIQNGRYLVVGGGVFIKGLMLWTAHTGTGQAVLNLPFTVANVNGNNTPLLVLSNNWTGTIPIRGTFIKGTTQAFLYGTNLATTTLDTAATFWFEGFYEIP